MPSSASLAEPLILDVLRAEAARRPVPRVLLIGMQSCSTVQVANEIAGADRVDLLHLDRAAGAVGCGLGNAERYVGLGSGSDGGESADPPVYSVVALNVEAAKSYRLLREVVGSTVGLVAADGCALVAGPRKGGAEVAARVLEDLFESVELVAYRKGERIYRAVRPTGAPHPQPLPGAHVGFTDTIPHVRERGAGQPRLPSPAHGGGAGGGGLSGNVEPVELRGRTLRLRLDDRIFARGRLDPATKMLAEAFEVRPGAAVLDLGAGNGVLGIVAALLEPTCQVTLVDSDPIAVEVSRQNAGLNGAANVAAHISDLLHDLPGQTFDLVLMNPPFHRGRQHDRALGERFMAEASGALRPGGTVFVVCNRFLRYEPTLERLIGSVREVAGDRQFKVLTARRALEPARRPSGGGRRTLDRRRRA